METDHPPISFRLMKAGEEPSVIDLVLKVFSEFVAPQYVEEGVEEFKKYVTVKALADRVNVGNIFLLATLGKEIIGVIEIREDSHIAMLFVEKYHQRKGLAKNLLRRSIDKCRARKPDLKKVTVNASPNAYNAYQKLGFNSIGEEKVVNGIRFIPMEVVIVDIMDDVST